MRYACEFMINRQIYDSTDENRGALRRNWKKKQAKRTRTEDTNKTQKILEWTQRI